MTKFEQMRWGWLFSYGDDNCINFLASPLTQILGRNGHGKSSIALILEEAIYNKNSKGIKKADILNRNSTSKSYWIELDFSRDQDSYCIKTTRGTTQTVKLLKNNQDISAHTATATYKLIEELIGYDHKTFAQIIYLSSASSLEFLTATDSNRKKFLIEILKLTKYIEAADIFKAAAKEVSDEVTVVSTKISSIDAWLKKYAGANTQPLPLVPVPVSPRAVVEEVSALSALVAVVDLSNKKIIQNNKYKEILDSIVLDTNVKPCNIDITSLNTEKIEYAQTVKNVDAFILKMRKLGSKCATCEQPIDKAKTTQIIDEQLNIKTTANTRLIELNSTLAIATAEIAAWKAQVTAKKDYEEYHSLYDASMESELLNKADLVAKIAAANLLIDQITQDIEAANERNNKASAHNARAEVLRGQLLEMQTDLLDLQVKLKAASGRLTVLQVLVKTFSSTGLVAYKIECLVKDLEAETNKYLADLSGGRFQISFKIAASDKLNVVVTDGSRDIDMLALSSGERARVNTAALLGIRRLMQSLSNNRINLLILDETIENLDDEGKEKLVEVLLAEAYLNTFVISHGFSHPLLEKLQVVKTKNISRIE